MYFLVPALSAGSGLSPEMCRCLSGQYAVPFHIPGGFGMLRTGCFSVQPAFLFLLSTVSWKAVFHLLNVLSVFSGQFHIE